MCANCQCGKVQSNVGPQNSSPLDVGRSTSRHALDLQLSDFLLLTFTFNRPHSRHRSLVMDHFLLNLTVLALTVGKLEHITLDQQPFLFWYFGTLANKLRHSLFPEACLRI
jgi:hypothetical protein